MASTSASETAQPALPVFIAGGGVSGEEVPVCVSLADSDKPDSVPECSVEGVFEGSLSDVTYTSRVGVAAGQSTHWHSSKAFTRAGIPALSATTTLPAKPSDLQCLAMRSLDATMVIFSSNGVTLMSSMDHR